MGAPSAFRHQGFTATIRALRSKIRRLYLEDESPWVVGYSGGKDSSAALCSIAVERMCFLPVASPCRASPKSARLFASVAPLVKGHHDSLRALMIENPSRPSLPCREGERGSINGLPRPWLSSDRPIHAGGRGRLRGRAQSRPSPWRRLFALRR